jgi:hypothetical protein
MGVSQNADKLTLTLKGGAESTQSAHRSAAEYGPVHPYLESSGALHNCRATRYCSAMPR